MNETRELFQTFTRRFGLLNKNCCAVLDEEISLVQSHLLYQVAKHPDSAMQEIADQLALDITTFSRQVQTLIKRDLLVKRPAINDRRIHLLRLSEKGLRVAQAIDEEMKTYLDSIFSSMTSFEKAHVLQAIDLLNTKMGESDVCCKPCL